MGLFKDLKALNKKIEDLIDERGELGKKIAEAVSPYKIGEETDAKGYFFNGKRCRIRSIEWDNNEGSLLVRAVVLKKDGTESSNLAKWGESNDSVLRNAVWRAREAEEAGVGFSKEELTLRRFSKLDGENGARVFAICSSVSGAEFKIDLTETRYAQAYDFPELWASELQSAIDNGELEDQTELLEEEQG